VLKLCSRCSREAELSFVCVLSTLGARPRRQKCSAAVLFCLRCMRDLVADGGHFCTDDVRKSVNNAYTHIDQPSGQPGDGADPVPTP
jgi:hypothetical protein